MGTEYNIIILCCCSPPLFAMRVSHRRLHALRRRSFIVARESLLTSPPNCCWQVRPHTRGRLPLVRRHVLAATLPAPRHRGMSPARSLRNSKPEMAEHLCAESVRLSPCCSSCPFAVYYTIYILYKHRMLCLVFLHPRERIQFMPP